MLARITIVLKGVSSGPDDDEERESDRTSGDEGALSSDLSSGSRGDDGVSSFRELSEATSSFCEREGSPLFSELPDGASPFREVVEPSLTSRGTQEEAGALDGPGTGSNGGISRGSWSFLGGN